MVLASSQKEHVVVQVHFDPTEIANTVVETATSFVSQVSDDGIILTICQTTPPVILGSPEEQKVKIRQVTSVRAKVLARYCLTPARAKELMGVLKANIDYLEAKDEK